MSGVENTAQAYGPPLLPSPHDPPDGRMALAPLRAGMAAAAQEQRPTSPFRCWREATGLAKEVISDGSLRQGR